MAKREDNFQIDPPNAIAQPKRNDFFGMLQLPC